MRLIDADALMEECYKELEDNSLWHDEDTSKDYADGHDEGKRIMMTIIDQAPTIDVDRPQGEWIVNIFDYKSVCSVCGANETDFIYGTEMWYGLGKSKFCPSCGARMKGVDDEIN